ncbi:MAG: hypothetical protein ABJA37_13435 [Ferruginibacter sp.]
MKSTVFIFFLWLFQSFAFGQNKKITTEQYKQDFDFFWTSINDEYCYFDKKHTDWLQVKEIYYPMVDTVTGRDQFVTILEKAFG